MPEVRLIIRGDNQAQAALNQVSRGLREIAGDSGRVTVELDRTERATQKAKTGFDGFKDSLGKAQSQIFFVSQNLQMLAQAGQAAFDLLMEGAVALEIGDAFEAQLDAAGQSLDEWMAKLNKASGGTIDDTTLMATAAKAMALGVTQDVDEMAALLEVARFKGRRFGRDTADAFDDIAVGVGRLTPRILDNIGIIIEEEAVYGAFAESLGKAADELTEVEKRQAVVNEIIRQGQEEIEKAGGLVDSTADKYRNMARSIENLRSATLGLTAIAVAPVLNEWAIAAQATADWLSKNEIIANALAFAVAGATGEWDRAAQIVIGSFNPSQEEAGGAMDLAGLSADDLKSDLHDLRFGFDDAADGASFLTIVLDGAAQALANFNAVKEGFALLDPQPTVGGFFRGIKQATDEQQRRIDAARAMMDRLLIQTRITNLRENRQAAEQAAREWEQSAEEAARTVEQAWESAFSSIRSAVEGAIDLSINVREEDFLLEKFGLREEAVNEAGRRLAAIRDAALKGERHEFVDMFFGEELGQFNGEELAAHAQKLLDDIAKGLRFDLLNEDAILRGARESLIASQNKTELVDRLTAQLVGEGLAEDLARRALGEELGGPLAKGLGSAFSDALGPFVESAAPQMETAATEIVEPAVTTAAESTDTLTTSFTGLADEVDAYISGPGAELLGWVGMLEQAYRDAATAKAGIVPTGGAPTGTGTTGGGTGAGGGAPVGPGFASGVSGFIVPPGFPNDSFPIRVSSGERVDVTPAGQSRGNAPLVGQIIINAPGGNPRDVEQAANRGLREAARAVGMR